MRRYRQEVEAKNRGGSRAYPSTRYGRTTGSSEPRRQNRAFESRLKALVQPEIEPCWSRSRPSDGSSTGRGPEADAERLLRRAPRPPSHSPEAALGARPCRSTSGIRSSRTIAPSRPEGPGEDYPAAPSVETRRELLSGSLRAIIAPASGSSRHPGRPPSRGVWSSPAQRGVEPPSQERSDSRLRSAAVCSNHAHLWSGPAEDRERRSLGRTLPGTVHILRTVQPLPCRAWVAEISLKQADRAQGLRLSVLVPLPRCARSPRKARADGQGLEGATRRRRPPDDRRRRNGDRRPGPPPPPPTAFPNPRTTVRLPGLPGGRRARPLAPGERPAHYRCSARRPRPRAHDGAGRPLGARRPRGDARLRSPLRRHAAGRPGVVYGEPPAADALAAAIRARLGWPSVGVAADGRLSGSVPEPPAGRFTPAGRARRRSRRRTTSLRTSSTHSTRLPTTARSPRPPARPNGTVWNTRPSGAQNTTATCRGCRRPARRPARGS